MLKKGIAVIVLLLTVGAPLSVGAAAPQSLSSLSAVLYEPQSGRVLYEKDADTKRPMASTTKLMTALVAAQALDADTVITVPASAVLVEGSSMGLRGGDTLTVRDLLTGMLLSSGNDAANAAALVTAGSLPAFADRMNRTAAALGMSRSLFVTPSGLDEGEHGSTARDMALLGAAVLRAPLLSEICASKTAQITLSGRTVTYTNHNRLLSLYAPAIGLKTGFTKKSGRCLVSAAERDGVTLVVATLNGGDYWNDHIALYEYGFSLTERVSLTAPALSALPVIGGTVGEVAVRLPEAEAVTLVNGEASKITCRVIRPAYVWAPLAAGDTVGTVRYECDGRTLCELPILAAETVQARAPLSFFEKWKRQSTALLTALLE